MTIRLLVATPDVTSLVLLRSVVNAARNLVCFSLEVAEVAYPTDLLDRVDRAADDVILLDWEMARTTTVDFVKTILDHNPKMRIIVLLPSSQRQYRQLVWEAGACNSIPKEYMEQEWLSSVLCVMVRSMQREQKLRAELQCAFPTSHLLPMADEPMSKPLAQSDQAPAVYL